MRFPNNYFPERYLRLQGSHNRSSYPKAPGACLSAYYPSTSAMLCEYKLPCKMISWDDYDTCPLLRAPESHPINLPTFLDVAGLVIVVRAHRRLVAYMNAHCRYRNEQQNNHLSERIRVCTSLTLVKEHIQLSGLLLVRSLAGM